MSNSATISDRRQVVTMPHLTIPAVIAKSGPRASRRFVEFFTAEIRNANTRRAYGRSIAQFCQWCDERRLSLDQLNPVLVAAYIEMLGQRVSRPSVKQALAAIRMFCDYLVLGHALETNPAASVRGPKHVVKKGKTPVLNADEARALLDAIDVAPIAGLRDRALIATMLFSFARVGAVVGMNVEDYYLNGRRFWLRLREKGGKHHEVPVHHRAEAYLDAYLIAAGFASDKKAPLFRTLDRHRQLTERRVGCNDVLRMVKRRASEAGIGDRICCHSFRATGITLFLQNGGTIEKAAAIAAHESTRTTQLYNRTNDAITLDEIERILI